MAENTTLTFTLEKPANKTGGDKYTCLRPGKQPITIYLPQDISRPTSPRPTKSFLITLKGE